MSITREFIPDGVVDTDAKRTSILKPYVMSHGTLECSDLSKSRRFYEEFLGLECVRHSHSAMAIRCGLRFHVVCVEVGSNLHPANLLNHWGIDMESQELVDQAYSAALQHQNDYAIKQVLPPVLQHGVYSFYIEDLDHNWWEVQYYENFQHDDFFDFGDRF